MHPAASVIGFTVASGAGYGLLALLGLGHAAGVLPDGRRFGLVACGLALALVTAGLLASTAHLGRPERAWRAVSQWRTSWLSREAVAALATYLPASLFAAGWGLLGATGPLVAAMGLLAAAGAAVTVAATGMIYASLKPVAQWHSRFTVPVYLALALASGLTLMTTLLAAFGQPSPRAAGLAAAAALGGWLLKRRAWALAAAEPPLVTANSATGLAGGTVRSIEWPHTRPNYVLKEMGYRVARKHAARLRTLAQALGFAAPAALLPLAASLAPAPATALSLVAAATQATGLVIERWLFFAEAEHTVTLYY
jgi:DMSO reductase anchor subunit